MTIAKREGHDLIGPCVACNSSDAFHLHGDEGVAHCFSCGGKWSPFQVAEAVLRDREQAKAVMVELGLFTPAPNTSGPSTSAPLPDPIAVIANAKGVTPESLRVFGAKAITPYTVRLAAYGPDGKQCTHFDLSVRGGKGKFAYQKSAGLFFPHENSKVRLPQPGETWHLVEGCKDAAALHGLGLLACGLNTCRLAAKFARLFQGVEIVLVPDRDAAGEEGAQHSARVLRGVAPSVRVAVLPAEFKESGGEDIRDVLRRPDGRELVLQAIADAQPLQQGSASSLAGEEGDVSAEIEMPEGDPLVLTISPCFGKPQRLVVAKRGDVAHRDRINTDSSISRDRFVKRLAGKLGMEVNVLGPLVDPQITELADQVDEQAKETGNGGDGEEQSQATLAANMAAEWDLWHTPSKDAYATFPVGEHLETWPIRSKVFKRFLAKQFFEECGKAINSEALGAAINLIEAQALFDGGEHLVHVRVAEHDGKVYLDLCNPDWQAVEISPAGWRMISESPVKFRRSAGMLPLPAPESGDSLDELRTFLNVEDSTWPLVVAWLVAALRPRGPYPVLALFGEQGSAKSTTGRLLRDIVDPNSAPLRAEPRDGRDLMIGANNSWCLAYDNLSHVPPWLSDALCRLSTGGGFATRELYTDQDEVIFDSQRPVLLTSIEDVATRADLLDRCVIVWLPAIPESGRRPEAQILKAFEKVRPRILGALLDAVAGALKALPSTKLDTLPRMADFALWVAAAEASLGWPKGTFSTAYAGNRASANEVALEASPVARPLVEMLDEQGEWVGTSSDLLQALEARVGDQVKRQRVWPSNGRSMTGHLKRLSPNLRAAGWEVEFHRESSRRLWSIRRQAASASSDAFASPLRHGEMGADRCGPMQADASQRVHDAGDANDAIAGVTAVAPGRDGDGWEEGDL
ncbi:MAG: hypothetical protein NTW96_26605 [Planctomycetia bacterium]|nr:hypothetical protein [Planctomycetia bacterium]